MALSKAYTNDYGIVTNYHKVSHAAVHDGRLDCMVDSYVSKTYRDAEKFAVNTRFTFKISLAEEESMGIRALCYKKIKELEDWSDAEDC